MSEKQPVYVTIFVPNDDSCDHHPVAYAGKLTKEQIEKVAAELGGVGSGGYNGMAVARTEDNEFLVTYCSNTEWETEPYGHEGERIRWDQQGHLHYTVLHEEIRQI